MFRNGEFEDSFNPSAAKKHQSFYQKPTPILQMQSKLAKLEVPTNKIDEKSYSEYIVNSAPRVPITYDTVYDPNDPNADWSGLVSKSYQHKRQTNENHPSKLIGMIQEENGIISKEIKKEWPRRRREYNSGAQNNNGNIISGIEISDQERWKSNAQRQNNFEATSKDQLVLNKRLGTKRTGSGHNLNQVSHDENYKNYFKNGTPDHTPRELIGGSYNPSNENNADLNKSEDIYDPYTLVGYKAPQKIATGSLLKDIGGSLLNKLSDAALPSKTTPYIPSKSLISQNYNPAPGSTII